MPQGVNFIPLTEKFYDDYNWGTAKTYSSAHNSQLDYGTNAYADPHSLVYQPFDSEPRYGNTGPGSGRLR